MKETYILKNALSGVKSINISVDDFLEYKALQQEEIRSRKPLSFSDDKLVSEPFFHGLPDVIYSYRCHLLKYYKMQEHRGGWGYDVFNFANNEFLKTASDNDFFQQLEDFLTTHNL